MKVSKTNHGYRCPKWQVGFDGRFWAYDESLAVYRRKGEHELPPDALKAAYVLHQSGHPDPAGRVNEVISKFGLSALKSIIEGRVT